LSENAMPLPDTFTQHEVNNAVGELKACLDDAKEWCSYSQLETNLPRLAYLFRHDPVLIYLLNELPACGIQDLIEEVPKGEHILLLPFEPKARLSKQIVILMAVADGNLDLWSFSEACFGQNNDFWEQIYEPATRDILRYVTLAQKEFIERKKASNLPMRKTLNPQKNYALDLFISHSSKDKRLAKSLIEFLRAALAIPADRVRCTSVDGYKLSGGAKTESELKKEIRDTQCFIGLITPDSLQSQFVLFELGARWGLDEHLVPILGGGVTAGSLHPPLSNLNALNSTSQSEMEQLVHELAKVLKRNVPLPTIYKAQLSALIETKSSKLQTRKAIRPTQSAQETQTTKPPRLDWHNYVSDEIFGVRWEWRYKGNMLDCDSLAGFCPKQGCMNRLESGFDPQNPTPAVDIFNPPVSMTCHRCRFKRHFDCDEETLQQRVVNEIERLVKTGQYMQRPTTKARA
jgi:hypothetical protein